MWWEGTCRLSSSWPWCCRCGPCSTALSRPAVAFYAAGSNKVAWVIVLVVATFFFGIGFLLDAFYLVSIRRKVREQTQLLSRP